MKIPRVYPILDIESLRARACDGETAAQAWLEGGARILQFRYKGPWARAVFEQAERIAGYCRERGVTFVVNDRADMAKLLGAGLHVGQDDLAPGDARRLLGRGSAPRLLHAQPASARCRGRRAGGLRCHRSGLPHLFETEARSGDRVSTNCGSAARVPAGRWWRSAALPARRPATCSRPARIQSR